MVIESGTEQQFMDCIVDSCLPRVGEYWNVRYTSQTGTPIWAEFTVDKVTARTVATDSLPNIRLHYWFEMISDGRLRWLH